MRKHKCIIPLVLVACIYIFSACNYEDYLDTDSNASTPSNTSNTKAQTTNNSISKSQETAPKNTLTLVTTADLNIRTGAGTSNEVIYVAPKGKQLEMTGNEKKTNSGNTWYEVITPSGKTGWCSGKYVTLNEANMSKSQTTEKNNNNESQNKSHVKTEGHDYTTNGDDTFKNGNSGIYAYKTTGGSYYNYLIIDFEEGFVYDFMEGNGDITCQKATIKSGDLNSTLIVTYYDGSDSWESGLCFAYKNQPDHLLFQLDSSSNYTYDYYSTDLNKALSIRDKKTISDYK